MYSYIKTLPDEIENFRRIIVVPDIHQDLEKAKRCLMIAECINSKGEWIGNDTIVIQVGDQIDGALRGESLNKHVCHEDFTADILVLRFFNHLHRLASKKGGGVYSLSGNHELMNVQGIFTYSGTNGCKKCENERKKAFEPGGEIAKMLATTRAVALKVGRVVFVHAGFLEWHVSTMSIEDMNRTYTDWLLGRHSPFIPLLIRITMGYNGALTNRSYLPSVEITETEVRSVLGKLKADHMVIGHNAHSPGVTSLHNGKVFVVDPGISKAVLNNPAAVLEITNQNEKYVFRAFFSS